MKRKEKAMWFWATQRGERGMPCLWGKRRRDARIGCDGDERVVQVEVRVLKVDRKFTNAMRTPR